MSNRVALYVAIALVAVVGIWLIGYALFNLGGTTPGDGYGEPIPMIQQPD